MFTCELSAIESYKEPIIINKVKPKYMILIVPRTSAKKSL